MFSMYISFLSNYTPAPPMGVFCFTSVRPSEMNCELTLTYDTPAYMFNVQKNKLSRQTGSRNLTGPKTLPTIWHTYMKLVTKYVPLRKIPESQ
jgi:hypothetical protein